MKWTFFIRKKSSFNYILCCYWVVFFIKNIHCAVKKCFVMHYHILYSHRANGQHCEPAACWWQDQEGGTSDVWANSCSWGARLGDRDWHSLRCIHYWSLTCGSSLVHSYTYRSVCFYFPMFHLMRNYCSYVVQIFFPEICVSNLLWKINGAKTMD